MARGRSPAARRAGQFAIGTTTVACSASDAGGNTANATFTVKVRSAPEQLARLTTKVGGSPQLAALVGSLDPNRRYSASPPASRCAPSSRSSRSRQHPTQAAEWIADANRIRAVLAC